MIGQTYQIRETDAAIKLQMNFQCIAIQEKIDRTESSFAGNGKMTQKTFERNMEIAEEVSSHWL